MPLVFASAHQFSDDDQDDDDRTSQKTCVSYFLTTIKARFSSSVLWLRLQGVAGQGAVGGIFSGGGLAPVSASPKLPPESGSVQFSCCGSGPAGLDGTLPERAPRHPPSPPLVIHMSEIEYVCCTANDDC